VGAGEVFFMRVLGDSGKQLNVIEQSTPLLQKRAVLEDGLDFFLEHGRGLAMIPQVVVDGFLLIIVAECLEFAVHERVERQDGADPCDPYSKVQRVVIRDAEKNLHRRRLQQFQGFLLLSFRREVQSGYPGVVVLEEPDELEVLRISSLDTSGNLSNVAAEVLWDAVVQAQTWFLSIVEQPLELQSLDALLAVGSEGACQELAHLLFYDFFAVQLFVRVSINICSKVVLLCAVSLRLFLKVRLRVFSVQHVNDCYCQGEKVVARFFFLAGVLFF